MLFLPAVQVELPTSDVLMPKSPFQPLRRACAGFVVVTAVSQPFSACERSEPPPPFSFERDMHDQATFAGRYAHFVSLIGAANFRWTLKSRIVKQPHYCCGRPHYCCVQTHGYC